MYVAIRFLWLMALAVLTCSAGQNVYGQLVPYNARGTDAVFFPHSGEFRGVGVATHFGRSVHAGVLVTKSTGPLTAEFVSTTPMVITAASGDTLKLQMEGQVEFVPLDLSGTVFTAVWSAQANVVGGTGRFANAQPGPQPMSVVATNKPFRFTDPQWKFSWQFSGNFRLR